MIVSGFNVSSSCDYIHGFFQPRKYLSRIRSDFYFLGLLESRYVNHWYCSVYARPRIIQSAGIGYIQFPVLYADIFCISSDCDNLFDLQRSGVNPCDCAVIGTYICLILIKRYRAGLTWTAIVAQHTDLPDGFARREVNHLYGARHIDYYINLISIDRYVIGCISQSPLIVCTKVVVRTSLPIERITSERTIILIEQSFA